MTIFAQAQATGLVSFTADPVTYDVTAASTGDPRRIRWCAATGNAHIDESPHVFGFHLSEHAFEVYAREFFVTARPPAEFRTCCGEGHGWVHHYGWTGDGRFADLPTPCATCNPPAVAL